MMKQLYKSLICVLVIVVFTSVVACSKPEYIMDNYSDYIANLFQYELKGDAESPGDISDFPGYNPSPAEKFDGVENIGEYAFDFGTEFFGKYAFVSLGKKNYLLDRFGNLIELESKTGINAVDIKLEGIFYDKMLLKYGNLYGVSDLFGNKIVDFEYSDITIKHDIVVGKRNDGFDVYANGDKRHLSANSVDILTEELLVIDDEIYDLASLTRAKINGYYLADAPVDGIVKIVNDRGRIGYCDYPSGKVLIAPTYIMGGTFRNGIAYVCDYKVDYVNQVFNDYPHLINTDNKTIYDFSEFEGRVLPNEIAVYDHYDNCNVFNLLISPSVYGVVKISDDGSAAIHELDFTPKFSRVFGKYCLIDENSCFYSLTNKEVLDLNLSEIQPINGKFIVKKADNGYSLLNESLDAEIDSCDNIKVYEDTIMIQKNGKFSYYFVK